MPVFVLEAESLAHLGSSERALKAILISWLRICTGSDVDIITRMSGRRWEVVRVEIKHKSPEIEEMVSRMSPHIETDSPARIESPQRAVESPVQESAPVVPTIIGPLETYDYNMEDMISMILSWRGWQFAGESSLIHGIISSYDPPIESLVQGCIELAPGAATDAASKFVILIPQSETRVKEIQLRCSVLERSGYAMVQGEAEAQELAAQGYDILKFAPDFFAARREVMDYDGVVPAAHVLDQEEVLRRFKRYRAKLSSSNNPVMFPVGKMRVTEAGVILCEERLRPEQVREVEFVLRKDIPPPIRVKKVEEIIF
jgi:hypothetical protein